MAEREQDVTTAKNLPQNPARVRQKTSGSSARHARKSRFARKSSAISTYVASAGITSASRWRSDSSIYGRSRQLARTVRGFGGRRSARIRRYQTLPETAGAGARATAGATTRWSLASARSRSIRSRSRSWISSSWAAAWASSSARNLRACSIMRGERRLPVIVFVASGGARMQEGRALADADGESVVGDRAASRRAVAVHLGACDPTRPAAWRRRSRCSAI